MLNIIAEKKTSSQAEKGPVSAPMDADSEKVLDRFNLKVGSEVFNWVKDEQHRQRKETGKQPTQNEVMLRLIQKTEKSVSPETPEESLHKVPSVPRSLAPIVEWLLDLFARKGTPEQEALKNSIRILVARREAEVKRDR